MHTLPILLALALPRQEPATPMGPQAPAERYAAVFDGGSVLWEEFHHELARRYRGRPVGQKALEHLVERVLVEIECEERDLHFDPARTQARIAEFRRQLEQAGHRLEQHLADRHMELDEFRALVELSIATEDLVRKDLGIAAGERVPPEKIALWQKEMRKRHAVVTDPRELPTDRCAKVGDREIPLSRLGEVMAQSLVTGDKERVLRDMCAYRLLRAKAADLGVQVGRADLEAEVQARRDELAERPELGKVSLEDLLLAEGRTLADYVDGEVFRTNVLVRVLGEKLHPTADLEADFRDRTVWWQERIGPSRRVYRLWLQGKPKREPEQARKLLVELRPKLAGKNLFQAYARKLSEDPSSANLAGDLGLLHRRETRYPEELLEAAFKAPIGVVSEPVEDTGGWSLLFVSDVVPGPDGDARVTAMRRYLMSELLAELIKAKDLRFVGLGG
ncbi:MAG: peptidylprolyl isomerase [Planctomycetota bacterium]